VHQFDAGQNTSGGAERFKSKHWFGDSFDRTMVLLDDVVEVLDLPNDDWYFPVWVRRTMAELFSAES
jgi:hypothetical protein